MIYTENSALYGLTLLSLSLPLSLQAATCSGWRWFDVSEKLKKIAMYWSISFMEIFSLKPLVIGKSSLFSGM